jgi:hypothetical protein
MQSKVTSSLSFIAPARPVESSPLSEEDVVLAKGLPEDDANI